MDRSDIESFAVDKIRECLRRCDLLDANNINIGDKEPSWDGFVYLYKNKNHSKCNIEKRLPVQVKGTEQEDLSKKRYCQMLWIEVWIGIGLSDFLQHTIFKFHVLGHKVKLFKAFQSSPTFFCLPTEFKSHGFCGLCRSVALC